MLNAIIAMILHATTLTTRPPTFHQCEVNGGHVYRLYDGSFVCQE